MRAYAKCPACGTVDVSRTCTKPTHEYYVCICDACGNMYYQTYHKHKGMNIEVKPSQDDYVHFISVPVKTQEIKTTQQKQL